MNAPLLPIHEVARKLGLAPHQYDSIGTYGAKIKLDLLHDPAFPVRGKLILVTATTPTVSGEGKTVVSVGLTQGLERIGKKSILTSREPSLGPIFGLKGGAAGGGLSQVEPSQKINLHFHGDFHAIAAAHNLLAALLDAHIFHGNVLGLDPAQVTWPRTLDMNDRALRHIVLNAGSKREGVERTSGFVITAASEVMAILALAAGRADLRRRLNAIIVGVSRAGRPVTCKDLGAIGAMMALLNEALLPNLVQTTEGTPALVHTGPFANIAHGTSSVLSQQIALRVADYAVNEAGFASELGAEKYFDIVSRASGIEPAAAVLVATVRSLRDQGEGHLQRGFANLSHHIGNLRAFGVPVVAAINRFPNDTLEDLESIAAECARHGVPCSFVEAFIKGGAGATDLAEKVVAAIDAHPTPAIHRSYPLEDPFEEKIRKVATRVYGAADIVLSEPARAKLQLYREWGFGQLPVCIAKTQYSLTDDPKRMGAPSGWTLHINDVSLSAGAGFVVAISGAMMLMPGLPSAPRAQAIDVDDEGNIVGI
jgi:formate--tetrahydrofolate ligase